MTTKPNTRAKNPAIVCAPIRCLFIFHRDTHRENFSKVSPWETNHPPALIPRLATSPYFFLDLTQIIL
jgi:hypothetical protein